MEGKIERLFIVKRRRELEVLYYCPRCEAINEILIKQGLSDLVCHECGAHLTAEEAIVEAIHVTDEEL